MTTLLSLLLGVLAHAHDGHEHDHPDHVHDRTGALGDLDVEGELVRLDLPREAAVRMTATWTAPIAAPLRAIEEGRAAAWDFWASTLRVTETRLVDGETVAEAYAERRSATSETCALLDADPNVPLLLEPIDPRARDRGEAEASERAGLRVTWVDEEVQRTALVAVQPGDSVTVVELVPDAGARPRRRARQRRRIELHRANADLVVRESEDRTRVCVTPHPEVRAAEVVERISQARDASDIVRELRERANPDDVAVAEAEASEASQGEPAAGTSESSTSDAVQ